jgi:hypothetical protein
MKATCIAYKPNMFDVWHFNSILERSYQLPGSSSNKQIMTGIEASHSSKILDTLQAQLNHRLEKLWRVFNWCSSILISITAGVIAASASKDFSLTNAGRVSISLIIIIVTIYAWAWIQENLKFERNIRDQVDKIFEEELNYPQLKLLRPDRAKYGYKEVIVLLGMVALAATWVDLVVK